MKRSLIDTHSIYHFLAESGLLEHGTDEQIEAAKKQYWRKYRTEYRRNKRAQEREYTISLNHEELTVALRAAKDHDRSVTKYIKDAMLAYSRSEFLMPNAHALNSIRDALLRTCNAVQELSDDDRIQSAVEDRLIELLSGMEALLTAHIARPLSLDDAIRNSVGKNQEMKQYYLTFIKSL